MKTSSESGTHRSLHRIESSGRWSQVNDPLVQLLLALGAVVFALGLATGPTRDSGIDQTPSMPKSTADEPGTTQLVLHP